MWHDSYVISAPDVFCYRQYRQYLRDFYAYMKSEKRGFSLRSFSEAAGIGSSNYLKLVMDGDRNLSPEMAQRFARACGLSAEPSKYFCTLVAFNQATETHERDRAYEQLLSFPQHHQVHRLDAAYADYYRKWYIPAVRELCAHSGFQEDPHWIGRKLRPTVASSSVKKALSVLIELGMLVRHPDGGLRQASPSVEADERPLAHHVKGFQRTMMEKAIEALDRWPQREREIGSLTLCLSESQYEELLRRVAAFRNSLFKEFQSDADAERVVQVNLQAFPLSAAEGNQ